MSRVVLFLDSSRALGIAVIIIPNHSRWIVHCGLSAACVLSLGGVIERLSMDRWRHMRLDFRVDKRFVAPR